MLVCVRVCACAPRREVQHRTREQGTRKCNPRLKKITACIFPSCVKGEEERGTGEANTKIKWKGREKCVREKRGLKKREKVEDSSKKKKKRQKRWSRERERYRGVGKSGRKGGSERGNKT